MAVSHITSKRGVVIGVGVRQQDGLGNLHLDAPGIDAMAHRCPGDRVADRRRRVDLCPRGTRTASRWQGATGKRPWRAGQCIGFAASSAVKHCLAIRDTAHLAGQAEHAGGNTGLQLATVTARDR